MTKLELELEDIDSSSSLHLPNLLLYRDDCFDDKDTEEYLNKTWQALTDMGYDMIFGAYRGLHHYKKNNEICITFQKQMGTGDQVMMVAFKNGDWRIDFAYKELIDIEKEKNKKQEEACNGI